MKNNVQSETKRTKGVRCAHLKVFVKVEVPTVFVLLLLLPLDDLFLVRAGHDAGFLVVADALLEEVGLAGQRDGFHKVERVGRFVEFLVPERQEETVGDELDVLFHEVGVHAEQRARQRLCQELLLDGHGLGDDVLHGLLAGAVVQVGE